MNIDPSKSAYPSSCQAADLKKLGPRPRPLRPESHRSSLVNSTPTKDLSKEDISSIKQQLAAAKKSKQPFQLGFETKVALRKAGESKLLEQVDGHNPSLYREVTKKIAKPFTKNYRDTETDTKKRRASVENVFNDRVKKTSSLKQKSSKKKK